MRAMLRGGCSHFWLAIGLVLTSAGCQPVQENRTITWSARGDAVGFQHGQEGVFVADKDGGGLKKIFQPGADVLATSTPLWSPAGKRLIFTTARDPAGAPVEVRGLGREQDPSGNIYFQRSVVYTCWLRDEEGDVKEPLALFEAACDHVGYVAANLAVRWHPQGDRILYVKGVGQHQRAVFEYDLRTKQSRRIFPHAAEALIFDWAPDGEHLVCVVGSMKGQGDKDGIWIGAALAEPAARGNDWWQVPESGALAEGELSSLLERLRATRPAWTPDGRRFAFVSFTPAANRQLPGRHSLRLGTLAQRRVQVLAEDPEPFRDLHWRPDGVRLGVVQGQQHPSLCLIEPGGELSAPISRRSIRRFAGWSRDAKHVAYIVPGGGVDLGDDVWSFLLVPDAEARDAVILADGQGSSERIVFSGVRATFPQWSPAEAKLSVWFTFSPSYRSWLGQLLGASLRPGDPAAVFNPTTDEITWMAVNADEKVQVGHYYLLKRDYARAWKWYEEANREAPPPAQRETANLVEFLTQLAAPRDASVFQYYCLSKLGRPDDARAKLEAFERSFLPRLGPQDIMLLAGSPDAAKELQEEFTDPKGLMLTLPRDLYVAEVFLSVDAAEDGQLFFQKGLADARTDVQRFSKAVVLSQFLLVQKKYAAYTDLVIDTVAPLAAKLHRPQANAESGAGRQWRREDLQEFVLVCSAWPALLPLAAPDFLAKLPDETVRRLWQCWQGIEPQVGNDFTRQSLDFVRLAAAKRLGLQKEQQELADRIARHHPNSKEMVAELIQGLRVTGRALPRLP